MADLNKEKDSSKGPSVNGGPRYNTYPDSRPSLLRPPSVTAKCATPSDDIYVVWSDCQNTTYVKSPSKSKQESEKPSSWIQRNLRIRTCYKYVASKKHQNRCECGHLKDQHVAGAVQRRGRRQWDVHSCTKRVPCDSFGSLDFQGIGLVNQALYCRLSYDSSPVFVAQLLFRLWKLEVPKLIISVHGGMHDFEIQAKLKPVIKSGIIRAAETTGAWIFTNGLNCGVSKEVGSAVKSAMKRNNIIPCIGITPWGIVEGREYLVGCDRAVRYYSRRAAVGKLNAHHTHFLLSDNGTAGRHGAEVTLRRNLERYLTSKRFAGDGVRIPLVCVIMEGGPNIIRSVLDYVTDEPPVPVVVCDGSGRAADIIAFTHRFYDESNPCGLPEKLKDQLIITIETVFSLTPSQSEKLYSELLQCMKRGYENISIFSLGAEPSSQVDVKILSALLRGHSDSALDQFNLTMAWHRPDLADTQIFRMGKVWDSADLDTAMMTALCEDRVDFVKLLMNNGVEMQKFLTFQNLESLYNTKKGPPNMLGFLMNEVKVLFSGGEGEEGHISLIDVGSVLESLIGGAYRSTYCRKSFKLLYNACMSRNAKQSQKLPPPQMAKMWGVEQIGGEFEVRFEYPFHELFVWAVLMKRQEMARFLWQQGEEPLSKALFAAKLYLAMEAEAEKNDLDLDSAEELQQFAQEFVDLALALLDECYRTDDDLTCQLLTYELRQWSKQTCLIMAVNANARSFVSHNACQLLINELWLGGMRIHKNSNLKVIACILLPPLLFSLSFKTQEELKLMPQTAEEHIAELSSDEDNDYDSSSSSSSSSTSSVNSAHLVSQQADETSTAGASSSAVPISRRLKSFRRRRRGVSMTNMFRMGDLESGTSPEPKKNSNGGGGPTVVQFVDAGGEVKETQIPDLTDHNSLPKDLPRDVRESLAEQLPPLSPRSATQSTKSDEISVGKKFYEFYNAPITKFWSHTLAFMVFMLFFHWMVLVRLPDSPHWTELYVIACVLSMSLEVIREILLSEPVKLMQKIRVWFGDSWNIVDFLGCLLFLIAAVLRFIPETKEWGRWLYCLDLILWYVKVLEILSINKNLGPFVQIIAQMMMDMISFLVFMFLVLMCYGVARQSILNPDEDFKWVNIRDIFFHPYFMIYGEVYAAEIAPECGTPDTEPCVTGHWIEPALMSVYLLVENILLVNLLIAVFNNTYNMVKDSTRQVWKYQRYYVIMHHETKSVVPPPFTALSYVYLVCRCVCKRQIRRLHAYDKGLKLFLDPADERKLNQFESKCLANYLRAQEVKLRNSRDERIRLIDERTEQMMMNDGEMNEKLNLSRFIIQNLEMKVRHMEENLQQTTLALQNVYGFVQDLSLEQSQAPKSPNLQVPVDKTPAERPEGHSTESLPALIKRKNPKLGNLKFSSSQGHQTSLATSPRGNILSPVSATWGHNSEDALRRRVRQASHTSRNSDHRKPSDLSKNAAFLGQSLNRHPRMDPAHFLTNHQTYNLQSREYTSITDYIDLSCLYDVSNASSLDSLNIEREVMDLFVEDEERRAEASKLAAIGEFIQDKLTAAAAGSSVYGPDVTEVTIPVPDTAAATAPVRTSLVLSDNDDDELSSAAHSSSDDLMSDDNFARAVNDAMAADSTHMSDLDRIEGYMSSGPRLSAVSEASTPLFTDSNFNVGQSSLDPNVTAFSEC